MLRSFTYWILNILIVFVSRQKRRDQRVQTTTCTQRVQNTVCTQRVQNTVCTQCCRGVPYGGDMRRMRRYICRTACRPSVCLWRAVQKWPSVLLVVALMVAGSLVMVSLLLVNPLTTYNTVHDDQRQLPRMELPSDPLPEKKNKSEIPIKKKVTISEVTINYNKEEVQGVPEIDMAIPVGPDLEQPETVKPEPVVKPTPSWCPYNDLRTALTKIVDGTFVFVVVIHDADHVPLARNTLQGIERWTKKRNLLFVCRDEKLCGVAMQHGVPCYLDDSFPGSSAPVFKIIAKVLEIDYIPIYMDFESSMTRDFPYIPEGNIDMVIPYGNNPKAHSFFISRNTPGSQRFFKTAIENAEKNVNKSFPAVFRSVLDAILKRKPTFRLGKLPKCKFTVDPNCCVIRHPPFSSPADRILWLKDKQLWFYDPDGYYTDPKALYISYENNYDMGNRTIAYQVHALQNALAYATILNRILILPKFFCPTCVEGKCNQNNCLLSHFMNITRFDEVFGSLYREHSFRGHPLVPHKTKKSVSEVLLVSSALHNGMLRAGGVQMPTIVGVTKIIMPNDIYEGPNSDEVYDLFIDYATKYKILVFANFYGAFSGFTSAKDSLEFEMKLKKGIVLLSQT